MLCSITSWLRCSAALVWLYSCTAQGRSTCMLWALSEFLRQDKQGRSKEFYYSCSPTHSLCYAFKRFGLSFLLLSKGSSEQLTQCLRVKHCSCISLPCNWCLGHAATKGWIIPFVEVSLISICYVQSSQGVALLMQWCGHLGNCSFLQETGAGFTFSSRSDTVLCSMVGHAVPVCPELFYWTGVLPLNSEIRGLPLNIAIHLILPRLPRGHY